VAAEQILLTFVGPQDPHRLSLVGNEQVAGPVLTLTRSRRFDRVYLLATADTHRAAERLQEALRTEDPGVRTRLIDTELPANAHPVATVQTLRGLFSSLAKQHATGTANWFACTSAGTTAQQAAWLTLHATGAFHGSLLHVVPSRYPGEEPTIHEVQAALAPPTTRPGMIARETGVAYAVAPPETKRAPAAGMESSPHLERALRRLGIRGNHPRFRQVLDMSAAMAEHNVPVLIQGETGTGKGLLAQLIHELSRRRGGPFVSVNCGALPERLVESTLFGHRKGAFTGAVSAQRGKFELADTGTIFLDEIGELPLELQPKLLKVLEDGMVEPIGAPQGKPIDVRVIAATNRDLQAAVQEKRFREDLYYRLSYGIITIPPLRERRSDIHHIALHILDRLNASLSSPRRLSAKALQRLEVQPWRGNVRDLENVIGRSVLLSPHAELQADDLLIESPPSEPDGLTALPIPHENFSLDVFLSSARKQLILRALEMANGKQSEAARLLGISPQAVNRFLREQEG